MTSNHYFITGTDTDAGKTYVTCLLLEALRRKGLRAAGYKPVACGDRGDAIALHRSSHDPALTVDEVNPLYLKMAAAPYVAALMENKTAEVTLPLMLTGFVPLTERYEHVLVEGAGGWEVPLTETETVADLAAALGLPVILVVNNKLGALNHTLLTLQAIKARGLTCVGIILNYVRDERDPASITNRAVLAKFSPVPVLGEVMHGETEIEWPL
jgi:dethiobiotin synthetase